MTELDLLLKDIERLRQNLYKLIDLKDDNFQDPDIIEASKLLNTAITGYNKILEKKIKKG